jgi:hypothetical protein
MLQSLKKNKKKIAGISILLLIMLGFFVFGYSEYVPYVQAQSNIDDLAWDGQRQNIQQTTGLGDRSPQLVIASVIRIFLGFLGIIAVGLILYAGLLWMTSGGNADQVDKAKRILRNAIIGLLLILSAFAIATFIINRLADATGGPGSGNWGSSSGPGSGGRGISAMGDCSVQNVYPEPDQTEVPRNTSIMVNFKISIDQNSIMDASGNIQDNGVIRIRKNNDPEDVFIQDVAAELTNNNQTLILTPHNYLGDPFETLWYTVKLSNDIRTMDGGYAFDHCRTDFLEWRFQVSNKLDLLPPQVKNVFPQPDNARDDYSSSQAVAARGEVEVASQPDVHSPAMASTPVPIGGSPVAQVLADEHCSLEGVLVLTVSSDGLTTQLSQGTTLLGSRVFDGNQVVYPGILTLTVPGGNVSAGNSWRINMIPETQASNLKVGASIYVFVDSGQAQGQILVGGNTTETAANIAQVLSSNTQVEAASVGNRVQIIARVAGPAGNNLDLDTNTPTILRITPMSGGSGGGEQITVNDVKDKGRNSIIQINFSEPINPGTVSGYAADLADRLFVQCLEGPTCNNTNARLFACDADRDGVEAELCVHGNFVISNNYETLEFISDNQCGTNACGEPVYCLPENSRIRVGLMAAGLESCLSCETKTPFVNCVNGHCHDSQTGQNYPQAAMPFNGITDLAFNSLDGNRSGGAEGPISFFNENDGSGGGDNFSWDFYISGLIDISPPIITSTYPVNSSGATDLIQPIRIEFNKLMLSSTLRTGGVSEDGHKYINMWTYGSDNLGYWITKTDMDSAPRDGEVDYTVVEIRHSPLANSTSYRAQVGSGVRDIYQNCFKPSIGPACTDLNQATPSCCGGTPSADPNCE